MKAIAVPYIIALILGIVIVGLLGYWFFVLGGQTGTQATTQTCNAKLTSYCSTWRSVGYTPTTTSGGAVLTWGSCPETREEGTPPKTITYKPSLVGCWDDFASGCSAIGVNQPGPSDCDARLGVK